MRKDLLVIGGGINGVGTAADAAGRGLSVVLCEMGDLASGTSSASSNLIHGGLRYLENYEFGLVSQSLRERKLLQRHAPHLITAQEFVLPATKDTRPLWILRLGLLIYDTLAIDSNLPHGSTITIKNLGLQLQYHDALQYYDCTVDDSRLVLHVALQAHQHNAEILTRTKLVKATRHDKHWEIALEQNGKIKEYTVGAIVNAAGPYAEHITNNILNTNTQHNMHLVKGSHIVVPRMFNHDNAFVLQNDDRRIIFVIPYMKNFTLIGTTEVTVDTPDKPNASQDEINYLCEVVNKFVKNPISQKDIVHKYSGIRPLFDDNSSNPTKASREFVLDIDDEKAPVITLYGGKLTTYRHTAEKICDKLKAFFPKCSDPWTDEAFLPGGNYPNDDKDLFEKHILKIYNNLPADLLHYYLKNYGTRVSNLLINVHNLKNLGRHFGGLLYKKEVDYLLHHEWARTADDILWRRGKHGLFLTETEAQELKQYISQK